MHWMIVSFSGLRVLLRWVGVFRRERGVLGRRGVCGIFLGVVGKAGVLGVFFPFRCGEWVVRECIA